MTPPDPIQSWLQRNGLAELAPTFVENHISLAMLPSLTADDIREMGITSLGQRKQLLEAIAVLKEPVMPEVPTPAPMPVAIAKAVPGPRSVSPRSASLPVPQTVIAEPVLQPLVQAVAPDLLESLPAPSPRKSKRKAFSATFLTVSIGLHLIVALGAGYWVVQRYEAKRKLQFAAGPPTASPSKRALEHQVSLQKKKNAGGSPAQAKRISVTGLAAKITLPEMPAIPSASTQFVAGRMAGMGGAGFGSGLGFGNGSGMGVGGGAGGLGLTMFGARSGAGLMGFFYDLKQNKDGTPTELAPMANNGISLGERYLSILRAFGENWDTRLLEKYYRSQKPLIATQLYVPNGNSNEAAKAFGEEKKCVGCGWIVHYKGSAIAPKDGTFRFIGLGDNVMLVRLNGTNVFDFSTAISSTANTSADLGPAGPAGWKLGGGVWFKVRRGDLMKLEVLIGDYGGLFSDYLFIEEEGEKYSDRSDAPGYSAYPIFQVTPTPVPKEAGKNGNPVPARTQLIFPATGTTSALDMLRR